MFPRVYPSHGSHSPDTEALSVASRLINYLLNKIRTETQDTKSPLSFLVGNRISMCQEGGAH